MNSSDYAALVGLSMMSYKKNQKTSPVIKKALIYSAGDLQLRGRIGKLLYFLL